MRLYKDRLAFAPRAALYDARQAVRPGAENRRLLEGVPGHRVVQSHFGVGSGSGLPLALSLALFISSIVSRAGSGAGSLDLGFAHFFGGRLY